VQVSYNFDYSCDISGIFTGTKASCQGYLEVA